MTRSTIMAVIVTVCLFPFFQPAAIAQTELDLTYDPITGSLTVTPANVALNLTSQRGLFTQIPSIGVYELYEHYVSLPPSFVPASSLEVGPLLTPGLSIGELLQDLCATGRPYQGGAGHGEIVETVRLNGQTLHTEVANCVRPPRQLPPITGERVALLQYDPLTGNLRMRSQSLIGALEIVSQAGIFTGTPNDGIFVGVFDLVRPEKLFKLSHLGFVEIDMGPVVQPGLSTHSLLTDLCVDGAWVGGGRITLDYAYPGAGAVPMAKCNNFEKTTLAALSLEYDTQTGHLTINAGDLSNVAAAEGALAAEKGLLMTTLELRSESGVFTGPASGSLSGTYDQQTPFRILKQDREGFASLDLGPILTPGLSQEFLSADITLDATFLGRTSVAAIDVVPVPEPTFAWHALMLIVLRAVRRRRG